MAAGYGQKNFAHSIFYPNSPWGDLEVVVAYTATADIYRDLTDFMAKELLPADNTEPGADFLSTNFDNVTNISSVGVFQGSSNRS